MDLVLAITLLLIGASFVFYAFRDSKVQIITRELVEELYPGIPEESLVKYMVIEDIKELRKEIEILIIFAQQTRSIRIPSSMRTRIVNALADKIMREKYSDTNTYAIQKASDFS